MHKGAGAHRWWCTVVHGAIRCQAAGMHLGARCTQASVHLLRDSLITHNTTSVLKRPDAPRCTVHLGARRPGCTLVQVHKRPDAPRCTVQYGARRPGCTSVQVHGDPNAPHQGAGAARAPCVTLSTSLRTLPFRLCNCSSTPAQPLRAHWPTAVRGPCHAVLQPCCCLRTVWCCSATSSRPHSSTGSTQTYVRNMVPTTGARSSIILLLLFGGGPIKQACIRIKERSPREHTGLRVNTGPVF